MASGKSGPPGQRGAERQGVVSLEPSIWSHLRLQGGGRKSGEKERQPYQGKSWSQGAVIWSHLEPPRATREGEAKGEVRGRREEIQPVAGRKTQAADLLYLFHFP